MLLTYSKSYWSLPVFILLTILPIPLMARPKLSEPFWINPCRIYPHSEASSALAPYHSFTSSSEEELLEKILLTVRIALQQCQDFKEEFVSRIFKTDLEDHEIKWREHGRQNNHQSKDIPLQFILTLPKIYALLQTIAPELAELVRNMERYHRDFLKKARGMRNGLRDILYEIQMAMLELNVEFEDVLIGSTRQENTVDKSYRDLRDWFVYRDYMKSLEYILQLLIRLKVTQPLPQAYSSAAIENIKYPIVLLILSNSLNLFLSA